MKEEDHLYILWTNDNIITAEKMVFMYAINGKKKGWWKEITIIVWGAPTKVLQESPLLQAKVKEAQAEGVHLTACKACADQLETTELLEELGIEVIYWGVPLTQILKEKEHLITI